MTTATRSGASVLSSHEPLAKLLRALFRSADGDERIPNTNKLHKKGIDCRKLRENCMKDNDDGDDCQWRHQRGEQNSPPINVHLVGVVEDAEAR